MTTDTKPKPAPAASVAEPEHTEELVQVFFDGPLELAVYSFADRHPRTEAIVDRARAFRDSGVDPDALRESIRSYLGGIEPTTEAILERAAAFENFLLED